MKNNTRTLLARSTALYVACAIAASGPGFAQAQRAKPSREPVTLNFVNADIEAVARTMAAITGRNIVVDPRVKGTMTLSTERPVAPSVAYNQFLTALRLSGFTMVESQGLLKLVPEADAKLQTGAVYAGPAPAAGAQMVTQIFRLSYEPAGNRVEVTTGGYFVFDPDFEPVVWTQEERARGQAWGVPTVSTFHTYGTPPVE